MALDRPGELWITVEAGESKDSTRIELRVGGDSPGSIATVLPSPTPLPTVTLTPARRRRLHRRRPRADRGAAGRGSAADHHGRGSRSSPSSFGWWGCPGSRHCLYRTPGIPPAGTAVSSSSQATAAWASRVAWAALPALFTRLAAGSYRIAGCGQHLGRRSSDARRRLSVASMERAGDHVGPKPADRARL